MKIDTTQIEGYADMTAEEKVAALEAMELADSTEELDKLKNSVTKANSEAAKYKRELKQAEASHAQEAEASNGELASIKEQLAALQREKSISEHTASFIAQGYEKELAVSSATALIDGDTATLFANMQSFMTTHDKELNAAKVGSMKRPGAGVGDPDGAVDYSKLIEEARARNDMPAVVYYMRLQQQQSKK